MIQRVLPSSCGFLVFLVVTLLVTVETGNMTQVFLRTSLALLRIPIGVSTSANGFRCVGILLVLLPLSLLLGRHRLGTLRSRALFLRLVGTRVLHGGPLGLGGCGMGRAVTPRTALIHFPNVGGRP